MTSAPIPTENVLNAAQKQLRLTTRKAEALEESIKEQEKKHREASSAHLEKLNNKPIREGRKVWWKFWQGPMEVNRSAGLINCHMDSLEMRQSNTIHAMYFRAATLEKLVHQLQNIYTLASAARKAGQSPMNVSAEDAKLLKL